MPNKAELSNVNLIVPKLLGSTKSVIPHSSKFFNYLHYYYQKNKAHVIWFSFNLLWWPGKWFLHPGRLPKGALPRRLEGGVRALLCWLHQEGPLRRLLGRRQGCAGHRHGMGAANLHIMMDGWMLIDKLTMTIVKLTADGPANFTYLVIESVHVQ